MTSISATGSVPLPALPPAQPGTEAGQGQRFMETAISGQFAAFLPYSLEPAHASQPADANKPVDASKPADASRPADANKPADASKPADANKRAGDAMAAGEAHQAATPVQAPAVNRHQVGPRESVAGVPKRTDLGPALIHTSLILRQKYQKADVLLKVAREWHTEGPSERAAKRLEPLLASGAAFSPGALAAAAGGRASDDAQRVAGILVDAVMLHLIDRGDHAKLVQGYIDSLKRTGHYDSMVAEALADHPGKTRDWAEAMIEKALSLWDEPFPAEWLPPGDTDAPRYLDDEQRLEHFVQLLNPDARPEEH
jgi:hypothetical protein